MTLDWSMYDQLAIAGRRHGKREELRQRMAAIEGLPTFAVEWKCDWKGPDIMTDTKENLEKFDPSEWEFSADVSQRDAIRVMNEGGVVWSSTLQIYFRLRDDGVFCCFYTTKPWDWKPSALPNGTRWCIVIPRPKLQRKPEPVKPANPTADEILDALKCGKTVVDARGSKVVLRLESPIWERWATFPLTIKPEPKPRRRVTREEAIIAMVKDPNQHAWDEGGLEYRMQKGCHLQMKHTTIVDKVGTWMHTSMSHYSLYLDPPDNATTSSR